MTFQDQETAGRRALGDRPRDRARSPGRRSWRRPGRQPLAASAGSRDLVMLGRDGREVRITPEQIARGGFVVQAIPRPGEFALPAGVRLRFEAAGKTIDGDRAQNGRSTLWVQDAGQARRGRRSACRSRWPRSRSRWGERRVDSGAGCARLSDRSARRAARRPSRSCPSSIATTREAGCRRPGWIRRRSCWPTTSAGSSRLELKTAPVPGWSARPSALLERADHRRARLDRRRRHRGRRPTGTSGRWPPAT